MAHVDRNFLTRGGVYYIIRVPKSEDNFKTEFIYDLLINNVYDIMNL